MIDLGLPAPAPASFPEDKPRGGQALHGLLPPWPFLPTSPTRALTICSLYFPAAAGGPPASPIPTPPNSPGRPARALGPAVAAGSEPSGCGRSWWAAESGGGQAGTLGFPSPTFLSRPTGMCSSSSRLPARRRTTTWGPKNCKSLHSLRQARERRGAGRSMLGDRGWELTKGMVGISRAFSVLGALHLAHVLYLIFRTTLRGTVVSSLENAQLLARDHRAPQWQRED